MIFFATAMIASTALAQMPKECFFVTDMQGVELKAEYDDSELLSDLPKLMAYFQPGMRLSYVKGHSTDKDDEGAQNLTGVEIGLTNGRPYDPKKLPLSLIGNDMQGDENDSYIQFAGEHD